MYTNPYTFFFTIIKFKSDFGIIADFFVQKRKNNKYVPSDQQIKYVDEFLKLMKAITGDKKYTVINSKRGVKNMCDVLQGAIAEGRAEGRAEGEVIGTITVLKNIGWSDDAIIDKLIEIYNITDAEAKSFVTAES